jgi:hypothetical protein
MTEPKKKTDWFWHVVAIVIMVILAFLVAYGF